MRILLWIPNDRVAGWSEQLAQLLPEAELAFDRPPPDPKTIRYALLWQADPTGLADLPNLRAVFSLGAGVDGLIDHPGLPRHAPLVRMVDPGLRQGMSEYVLLQVLRCHHHLDIYARQQRAGIWRPQAHLLASERRVGVLGLGELGAAAARSLSTVGFDVAGWSRTPKDIAGVRTFAGKDGLAAMLARSDVLVDLLPLTPATRGLLDRTRMSLLPKGAFVINAARGAHLVEDDVLALLDAGHLAGAVLDVFAHEPLPPDHPFWTHPRIMVTPHVAAFTHPRTAAPGLVENIRRIERGSAPLHVVEYGRGY